MHNFLKSELVSFLTSENSKQLNRMAALAGLVGIINTLLISVINLAAKDVSKSQSVTVEFFGYVLLLIVFLVFTKKANQENIKNANDFIYRFKIRIMSNVFNSNLLKIDTVRREYILEVLSRDTQAVSQSVNALLSAFQAVATVFFLIIYMMTVSMVASLILLASTVFVFAVGALKLASLSEQMQSVTKKEEHLNSIYASFLNGYKEVKMHSGRALDLTREMVERSKEASDEKTQFLLSITLVFAYLQVMLYLVVGLMIFVVPLFSTDFTAHVLTTATTALFLASSLSAVILNIPSLSIANAAARTLRELSEKLSAHIEERNAVGATEFGAVQSLKLEEVMYTHGARSVKPFVLGPVSYEFNAGKIYFIRGNNGSGKTTLMRVLLGLYQADSGAILVNGEQIAEPANSNYRDLFAVVFSDFYLFKKLYGLAEPPAAELKKLLELFQMQNKVSVQDGAFSDVNFSTGQRKRLALIVALLEGRQFIVLDEWAADQDPEFRQEFYEQIIPKLRELGKTVIAITHDDQYYELADHVIYLENGKPINV